MKCDICHTETKYLVDHYCLLCPSCKIKNIDIQSLQRIAQNCDKEELMEVNNV